MIKQVFQFLQYVKYCATYFLERNTKAKFSGLGISHLSALFLWGYHKSSFRATIIPLSRGFFLHLHKNIFVSEQCFSNFFCWGTQINSDLAAAHILYNDENLLFTNSAAKIN